MDKESVVYTHTMEYYSPIKVELNNASCSSVDEPEAVILGGLGQKEKDKYQ